MKNITFEKYQGNGNDFVIIDSRGSELYKNYKTNKIFDIKKICNRRWKKKKDPAVVFHRLY